MHLRRLLPGSLSGAYLIEYGNPSGYLPLREHLAVLLDEIGITAVPSQIVLTHGASQALDLVIRHLLAPGDAALVDDPGYYNLFGNLRLSNVQMLGVPRNPDGPDIDSLERLAAEHRPKVYFTQSVMQNPTGTDMSPHVSFKVLQIAERYGFYVVEDDIFGDLQVKTTPRLAALDQLRRVIYVRSFSKTLSGSLRVGLVACSHQLANDFAEIKMLTSITSSQVTERLIYLMLVDGHYRKYLGRLQQRLDDARQCGQSVRANRPRIVCRTPGRNVPMGAVPTCRGLHGLGRARLGRRLYARPGQYIPSPFGALAVDAF
ncbi:MAG: aminotransferase class I/II-fold pyridoxal phosphate-dependent enzyme [Kiloniellaceae bacterium]|nr:aminotransferase class I/II-fold pyridoxal phosphate-dependent enzyme [Kiloniellaceae bacterium]